MIATAVITAMIMLMGWGRVQLVEMRDACSPGIYTCTYTVANDRLINKLKYTRSSYAVRRHCHPV